MSGSEDGALEERLKAALWFSIGKIVDEETLKLGVNATPQFIGALTEMLWAQIGMSESPLHRIHSLTTASENVSEDLQRFAKHAGREVISAEDVLLLARRNEGLETILRKCLDQQLADRQKAAKRK
ncbi:MAG: hypothetical protein LQ343_002308 [Gyalolechia ehrenbergii]|nr:MAG: hypothetical protein LQ343_002308 [Gyalolechia ehrenbergii]